MKLKSIISFMMLLAAVLHISAQKKPNILWIYSDDISLELSCYGNPDVKTPNLDMLASQGTRYTKAYTTAPVCSSSRSSIITGMYPTAINSLDHRTINKMELPEHVKPVTEYFREAGYFCSNMDKSFKKMGKTDFNFLTKNIFDAIDWQDRDKDQPFYAQVNIKYPHRDFDYDKDNPIDYKTVTLPACYPDHELIKADWAMYLESIQHLDHVIGNIIQRLKDEGVWENTIIFFFGDNGRPHLRDKQFLYEAGLHVPLIVYNPFKPEKNKASTKLVSIIDVTTTSLDLAGIKVPEHMHGKIFMGENSEKREYIYGFRQRCGDAPDNIRSITDGRYKLIWNRRPDLPYMQLSSYKRLQYPAFTVYKYLHSKGELAAPFTNFMAEERPEFEFYDLKKDPMEFNNLSGSLKHAKKEKALKCQLISALKEFEKGMVEEDEATITKAKEGSVAWFTKAMAKEGYTGKISDEEMMEFWYQKLLNKSFK
ncbi:sulfatase family protein [Saccharicrinis sp. 156]|uniref:sulfatase family protein n=1 Tax=Saccharicrinis sp. 156 TaxID=3417574 RepID=UPI003D349219